MQTRMHSKTKMSLAIHEKNFQPKIATKKNGKTNILKKYSERGLDWLCPEEILEGGFKPRICRF